MTGRGLAFADTNVFVYLVDHREPSKRALSRELLSARRAEIVVSTQVLGELHAVCTGKLQMTRQEALEVVGEVARYPVVTTDRDLVLSAARLAAEAQLSIWDAAIVRAAQRAGCTTLLTEDLNAGQRFGDLIVENPFA